MFHFRFLAVTVLVGSACVDPDPMTCPPTHSFLRPRPIQVAYAGAQAGVLVRGLCKQPGATLTGVDVTVQDPSGASVPFEVDEPVKDVEDYKVVVRFVPSMGNSIVHVEFEPDLGAADVTLVGMRDRANDQPVAELDMPSDCSGGFFRAGALAACTDSTTLHVFLDGGLLAQDRRSGGIEAGEVLWSWTDAGVTRWQGADRLELEIPLPPATVAVSADEARVVLDQEGDLWEFSVADGGLARAPLLLNAGVSGFLHPPIAVDGGWVWIDEANHQSCFRGPSTQLSCAPFDYPVTMAEGDGFWVDDGRHGFARFGAGPRPISFLTLTEPFEMHGGRPVFSYGERVVSVRSDTMELEVWPEFPGIVAVRTHHVFGFSGSHVKIYER